MFLNKYELDVLSKMENSDQQKDYLFNKFLEFMVDSTLSQMDGHHPVVLAGSPTYPMLGVSHRIPQVKDLNITFSEQILPDAYRLVQNHFNSFERQFYDPYNDYILIDKKLSVFVIREKIAKILREKKKFFTPSELNNYVNQIKKSGKLKIKD